MNNNYFINGVVNFIGKYGVFRGSMFFEEFIDVLSIIFDRKVDFYFRF